jgi:hypothetical protein
MLGWAVPIGYIFRTCGALRRSWAKPSRAADRVTSQGGNLCQALKLASIMVNIRSCGFRCRPGCAPPGITKQAVPEGAENQSSKRRRQYRQPAEVHGRCRVRECSSLLLFGALTGASLPTIAAPVQAHGRRSAGARATVYAGTRGSLTCRRPYRTDASPRCSFRASASRRGRPRLVWRARTQLQ